MYFVNFLVGSRRSHRIDCGRCSGPRFKSNTANQQLLTSEIRLLVSRLPAAPSLAYNPQLGYDTNPVGVFSPFRVRQLSQGLYPAPFDPESCGVKAKMGKPRKGGGARKCARRQVESAPHVETGIVDESRIEKATCKVEISTQEPEKSQQGNRYNPLLYIPPRIARGVVKQTARSSQAKSSGDEKGQKKRKEPAKLCTDAIDDVVKQDGLGGNTVQGEGAEHKENGCQVAEITPNHQNVLVKTKECAKSGQPVVSEHSERAHDKGSLALKPRATPQELSKAEHTLNEEEIGTCVKESTHERWKDHDKESERNGSPKNSSLSIEGLNLVERQGSPPSHVKETQVVRNSKVPEELMLDQATDTASSSEDSWPTVYTAIGPNDVEALLILIPVGSAPPLEQPVVRTSGLVPLTVLASFIHRSLELPGDLVVSLRCSGEDLGIIMGLTLQQFAKCMQMEAGRILELEYEVS